LFDGLSVANIEAPFEVDSLTLKVPQTNGTNGTSGITIGNNGANGLNGALSEKENVILPNGINNITITTGFLEPQ